MPSLIRFLVTIGILVGLAYGAMYGLVLYVKPEQREMTVRVPTDRINPVRAPQPAEPEVSPEPDVSGDENTPAE